MAEKPIGVMPICIIAIALGVMGFFGNSFALGALILNPKSSAPPGLNPKQAEAYAEFERKTEELAKESRPVQLILIPAMLLTSLMLLGGGIAGLKLRGRSFLLLAFAASLLIDTAGAVYGLIVQSKMMETMTVYMREMVGPGKAGQGAEVGMQIGGYAGLFFGLGWMVARTVFYVIGLVYFSKQKTREAFDAAA
jgi:hypothetical protein